MLNGWEKFAAKVAAEGFTLRSRPGC